MTTTSPNPEIYIGKTIVDKNGEKHYVESLSPLGRNVGYSCGFRRGDYTLFFAFVDWDATKALNATKRKK